MYVKGTYCAILLLILSPLLSAAEDYTTLVVKPDQSVRDIAQKYLGDAELWKEILDSNGLTSAVQIQPGMSLHIPSKLVVKANRAVDQLQESINQAIRLSARVFAEAEISRAVSLRDQVLAKRREREWSVVLKLASEAQGLADKAIAICKQKVDQKAEARLVDVGGTVQARTPVTPLWKKVEIYANLGEGDRLRTLGNSSAEVQFRDESRLRLDENSQVLIQRMRTNLLENREQASVSLLEGDVFALLGDNQRRNSFDLSVPGVELQGNSKNYYVNRAADGTRFANYEGELEVNVGDAGNVTLQSNEGVAMNKDGLSEVKKLLPRPRQLTPAAGANLYQSSVEYTWEPIEGAVNYWFELAPDRQFSTTLVNVKRVTEPRYIAPELLEGSYFWRISAVDKDDFPGPRSEPSEIKLLRDTTPPYLLLRSPVDGSELLLPKVVAEGVVEMGGRVAINGQPIEVNDEGDFSVELALKAGINPIVVEAFDPAGNVNKIEHDVLYRVPGEVTLSLEPSPPTTGEWQFLTQGPAMVLSGKTLDRATLDVLRGERSIVRGVADKQGRFRLIFPLAQTSEKLTLRVTSLAGKVKDYPFSVSQDSTPPQWQIDTLPAATAQEDLTLKGSVEGAVKLLINNSEVVLKNGRFSHSMKLREGLNRIEFQAEDSVGNISLTRRTLLLDHRPPELLSKQLNGGSRTGNQRISIRVRAGDASSLRATAPFQLTAGEFEYSGLLELRPARGEYEGVVYLPAGNRSKARLKSVTLSDQLGNRRVYQLQ